MGPCAYEFPARLVFKVFILPSGIVRSAGPLPFLDPVDFPHDPLVDGKGVFRLFSSGAELPDPTGGIIQRSFGHVAAIKLIDRDKDGLVADLDWLGLQHGY